MTLTPLEQAVLDVCHREFGEDGFPDSGEIGVLDRENTGAGRYTTLSSNARVADFVACEPNIVIEMDGLVHGLAAIVHLTEGGMPDCLELYLHGDDRWGGAEQGWRIRPRLEVSNA